MISIPTAFNNIFASARAGLSDYSSRGSRVARGITIFALAVFAAMAIAGEASAQRGFALLGTWQHTEQATQNTPAFTSTVTFNTDGTYTTQDMIAPRAGLVGVITNSRGRYRATGVSSYIYQAQAYQTCSSGGACMSCPGNQQACALAQQGGQAPGMQQEVNVQMQGSNRFTAQSGTWYRIR